jgi:hypothetical protein
MNCNTSDGLGLGLGLGIGLGLMIGSKSEYSVNWPTSTKIQKSSNRGSTQVLMSPNSFLLVKKEDYSFSFSFFFTF